MNWQSIWRLSKHDYLILVPILGLAFYMAFIPNISYPYPIHIDEWVHIAHNNALLQAADINYPDPFSGQATSSVVVTLEAGFHILFAVFYKISGMSWVDILRYFPSIIFAITALSVYIMARREGFGWEAALLTCLIPTTIGIMGPAFFVPVALCMVFVPLSLFLVFNFRNPWSYLLILVFTCFTIITHATSAVLLIITIVPCALLYLRSNPKHSLFLILVWAIPFVVTLPWTYDLIMSVAKSLFTQHPFPAYHDMLRIIQTYGYIPTGLSLLGAFWLVLKGQARNYGLVLGLLTLSLMLAVFFTLHYGNDLVYLRGILYTMLMLSIVAGAGLAVIKNLKLPTKLGMPRIMGRIGYPLTIALIVVILMIAIPARQNIPYYHMIDTADYQAFVWIRDNVGEDYERAIVDPWKATAFTAITGKYVHTRIHVAPAVKDREAYAFLRGGSSDTAFLRENGISIIYTRVYDGRQNIEYSSDNPDLVPVVKHIYLLK